MFWARGQVAMLRANITNAMQSGEEWEHGTAHAEILWIAYYYVALFIEYSATTWVELLAMSLDFSTN